jgi:hypothetical protein
MTPVRLIIHVLSVIKEVFVWGLFLLGGAVFSIWITAKALGGHFEIQVFLDGYHDLEEAFYHFFN